MSTTHEPVFLVPLDELHVNQDNPRQRMDPDQLAELVDSIQANGIISPLVVWPHADAEGNPDGFVILAGHRRFEAAKLLGLDEVPVYCLTGQHDEMSILLADNVIRADLTPLEEARAYASMPGDPAEIAKRVGRSEATVRGRMELLLLPEGTQEHLDDGSLPLALIPVLGRIAKHDPALVDLLTTWVFEAAEVDDPADQEDDDKAQRSRRIRILQTMPDEAVQEVLSGPFPDAPELPIAWGGSTHGWPYTWGGRSIHDQIETLAIRLAGYGDDFREAFAPLDWEEPEDSLYDRYGHDVRRELILPDAEDWDAARSWGCLLEVPGETNWSGEDEYGRYICDTNFLWDRVAKRIRDFKASGVTPATYDKRGAEKSTEQQQAEKLAESDPAAARAQREAEKQEEYEHRQAARRRNLDVGVALSKWAPKVDVATMKMLGRFILMRDEQAYMNGLALTLLGEFPVKVAKTTGRETVQYPKRDEMNDVGPAQLRALDKARTVEEALGVILRGLVAVELLDADAGPGTIFRGISTRYPMHNDPHVAKLAQKVAPRSVKDLWREQAEQERIDEERRASRREKAAAKRQAAENASQPGETNSEEPVE